MGGSSSGGTISAPSYNTPAGYAEGPIYSESAGQYPVKQFSLSLNGVPSYQTQMIQRPQIMAMEGYSRRNPYGDFGTGYDAFQRYQDMYKMDQMFGGNPMARMLYPFLGGMTSAFGGPEQNTFSDLGQYYNPDLSMYNRG